MSNSIPVIKFMFRAELKVFNDALSIQPHYEVEDVSTANDLATYLSTVSAGLVFASIRDKSDLIQLATFLKISKKIAKDTVIKLVVLNYSIDKTYEKAVLKLGIQDLIEPGINTKALKFKLDFWMKSLNVQIRNNANAATQKTIRTEGNKSVDKKTSDKQTMSWLEPLNLENDIWILKNDGDCKKVLSKWLIRLMGPSPYVGQWVEVKASIWRFDFKDIQKELFISGEGAWFFQGEQRPEFIWKENSWLITGETFDLYFRDENQIVSRLKSKERNITICKNSMFAKTKQSIIEESFDKELVFKREAEVLDDLNGKNKTDKINSDPLSGKNKTSENIDGNLTGKTGSEDAIKSDNLFQKTETEKRSSHWNGKNSSNSIEDDNFDGPKVDGQKDGPNLELERKDLEVQKYYKNHNETQQYEAVEAKERQAREDDERSSGKGHLSGRSATDSIKKNYDNSKAEREKKESPAKDNDLYGKSNTDKLKSHYGQKEKAESQGKDLDGKSSTDKLASHYGNPKDAKGHAEEKELKSKEFEAKERDKKERENSEIAERTKAAVDKMQARERERKEKEEQINKERSETGLKNTTEASEKEKKINEVISTEKDKNELFNRLEKEKKANRRSEAQEEEYSGKSKVNKNWEDEHDFAMKGQSSTDKLAAHYDNKKEVQETKDKKEETDTYAELFGKPKFKTVPPVKEKDSTKPVKEQSEENTNVLPLTKNREEKVSKTAEEKELDELTRDAKVISNLVQGSIAITCALDDFFEDRIIFKTKQIGIKESEKVDLDIVFKFLEKDSKLIMQGDVLSVLDSGDGTTFITVNISKANASSFETFMKLYERRQVNVNEFLKKVKGI